MHDRLGCVLCGDGAEVSIAFIMSDGSVGCVRRAAGPAANLPSICRQTVLGTVDECGRRLRRSCRQILPPDLVIRVVLYIHILILRENVESIFFIRRRLHLLGFTTNFYSFCGMHPIRCRRCTWLRNLRHLSEDWSWWRRAMLTSNVEVRSNLFLGRTIVFLTKIFI